MTSVSFLHSSLLFYACGAHAVGALSLLKMAQFSFVIFISLGILLFKHRVSFNGLKFGFEIGDVVIMAARIGSTPGVGEVVPIVL